MAEPLGFAKRHWNFDEQVAAAGRPRGMEMENPTRGKSSLKSNACGALKLNNELVIPVLIPSTKTPCPVPTPSCLARMDWHPGAEFRSFERVSVSTVDDDHCETQRAALERAFAKQLATREVVLVAGKDG